MNESVLPSLTTRTRVALSIARGIAAAHGDDDLSPIHVALGLLREGESSAVAALAQGGVDLRAMRAELEAGLGAPRRPRPGEVALPRSPGEERLLQLAAAESRAQNDVALWPHHLLLAMLRDPQNPVATALARHDFGVDTAIKNIEAIFNDSGHAPPAA